jgi:spore coat polysaccharide biosynthesis protein SpsF
VTAVAIIQARVGSTRLPAKVLEPISGEPMLARVVERVRRARSIDRIVVATSTLDGDDAIAAMSRTRGWDLFRGSSEDVLDRYYQAARASGTDEVVRITSDCPLIDPMLIDDVVAALRREGADYASNSLEPRTFPRGLDVEALTFETLERAWRSDRRTEWREHVTPYIYRHPNEFRIARVTNDEPLGDLRWCVDTTEDLELVRRIWAALAKDAFSWRDVLGVVERNPEWTSLNATVTQKVLP